MIDGTAQNRIRHRLRGQREDVVGFQNGILSLAAKEHKGPKKGTEKAASFGSGRFHQPDNFYLFQLKNRNSDAASASSAISLSFFYFFMSKLPSAFSASKLSLKSLKFFSFAGDGV
jgi:hypothetical protein